MTQKIYHDDYKDLNSPRSRGLIQEVTVVIVLFCRRTFPRFVGIKIKRIFRGSVGLDFDMIFEPSANSTNSTIVEKFTEANGTKELQFVVLGKATAVDNTPVILSPNETGATTTTTAFAPDIPTSGKSDDWYVPIKFSLNASSFLGLYCVKIKSNEEYHIGRRISSDNHCPILYHVISFIQWEPA